MAVKSDSSELPRASGIAPSRNWRRAVPSDSTIMAIARHASCRMLKRYRRRMEAKQKFLPRAPSACRGLSQEALDRAEALYK